MQELQVTIVVMISFIGGFPFLGSGDFFFFLMLSTDFKEKDILGIIHLVFSFDQSLIICVRLSVFP